MRAVRDGVRGREKAVWPAKLRTALRDRSLQQIFVFQNERGK